MEKLNLWGQELEIDRDATIGWYETADAWGCECDSCKNFVALAKKRELPTPLLEALDGLGIPAEKATYVCKIVPKGNGSLYQFSYRIAGKKPDESTESFDLQPWGEPRCCHEIYPYGAPDFPEPHFDLEFWVVLPQWADPE